MSNILVVDDDEASAHLFSAILKQFGHRATCAHSGSEAIKRLGGFLPDLVILDVMMPDMNGLEVLQQIRSDSRTAAVPVVMFSALDDEDWRERAALSGADDYWIKGGFDSGELEQRVQARLSA